MNRIVVNIDVPALHEAIDFYQAALGLRCHRIIDGDVAEMIGTSAIIYLLEKPAASSPIPLFEVQRDYGRHWTPVHLDFVVDDIKTAAKRATDAGAKQESECVEWHGSKCIHFSDPFGHGFCLIEFENSSYSDA